MRQDVCIFNYFFKTFDQNHQSNLFNCNHKQPRGPKMLVEFVMQYFIPTSSHLLGICIDMGEGRRCSVASSNDTALNPPLHGQPVTASILKELPELSKAAPHNWQLLISSFFAKISNIQGAHSGDSQLPLHRNENKVISSPFSFTFHICLLATNATYTHISRILQCFPLRPYLLPYSHDKNLFHLLLLFFEPFFESIGE